MTLSTNNIKWLALLLPLVEWVRGDIYLHCPPGGNNRLDEQNRERNNANRMCDTQNNNRGGYNVGKMQYYKGEKVPIMWTNQHGSSKYQMEHTDFVLQYMCDPLLRDGTTTNTIPERPIDCENFDCDIDVRYGRHESYGFYQRCKTTERNKGLFTAGQNLNNRNSAKHTRQNPNGNRHGYECPEERDYYPYWGPSPWKDIAYITNDVTRCEAVTAQSQNVAAKHYCRLPDAYFAENELPQNFLYPNNKAACEDVRLPTNPEEGAAQYNATWVTVPAWGIPKPECVQTEQTRANHLGLIGARTQYTYQWTVPEGSESPRCALRIRYNITTADFEAWGDVDTIESGVTGANNAMKQAPNPNNDPAQVGLWKNFGLADEDVESEITLGQQTNNPNDANSREYVLKNNPQVELLRTSAGEIFQNGGFRFKVQLAINTAQFGRTFQDRTHAFAMKNRPANIPETAEIKLQTVAGKRGNIVQTFPGTEYFYIPEEMHVETGDYVHFQHTGSNTNPNNNDGQGKQGTDRSNYVPLRPPRYGKSEYSNFNWDMDFEGESQNLQGGMGDTGDSGASYPAFVRQPDGYQIPDAKFGQGELYQTTLRDTLMEGAFGGQSSTVLMQLATGRQAAFTDFGNMEELDDASTSFNLAPLEVTTTGCWNYVGTRNNNFSNRSQKGKFCVQDGTVNQKMVGANGGEIWTKHGNGLIIWPETTASVQTVKMTSRQTDIGDRVQIANLDLRPSTSYTVMIRYEARSLHSPTVMFRCLDSDVVCANRDAQELDDDKVEYTTNNGETVARVNHDENGELWVEQNADSGAIAGIVIGSLCFCCAISAIFYYKCKDNLPDKFPGVPV